MAINCYAQQYLDSNNNLLTKLQVDSLYNIYGDGLVTNLVIENDTHYIKIDVDVYSLPNPLFSLKGEGMTSEQSKILTEKAMANSKNIFYLPGEIETSEQEWKQFMAANRGKYVPKQNVRIMENVTLIEYSTLDISMVSAELNNHKNFHEKWIGNKFPKHNFNDMDGRPVSLDDFEGKVIVLNFWFIGCKPCVEEMPHLNEIVDEYREENIVFLAPALDSKEKLDKFLTKNPFKYRVLHDSKDFTKTIGNSTYPLHVVIDKDGIVRELSFGGSEDIKTRLQLLIDAHL